jgi:hypothetical protein
MVESDIILLYVWSRVWGIIYVVGPSVATIQTPWRPFPSDVRKQKVLDTAIDEVSGALSTHTTPLAIWIVCGTRRNDNPVSWTSMVGPRTWLHYRPLCEFLTVL